MEAWVIALLFALGTPVAGLAAAAAIRWRLRRDVARIVRTTPLTPIAGVRPDARRTAVQGTAQAVATLEAPIAGVPVIGYRVTIEFTDPGGRETSARRHVIDASRMSEFDLVDDTGTARVKGNPALLAAAPRVMDAGDVAVALTGGALQTLIQSEGHAVTDLVAARHLRATERLLLPDGPVYVCGRPRTEVDPTAGEAGYRKAPTRVVLEAPGAGTLVVADCHRGELLERVKERLG